MRATNQCLLLFAELARSRGHLIAHMDAFQGFAEGRLLLCLLLHFFLLICFLQHSSLRVMPCQQQACPQHMPGTQCCSAVAHLRSMNIANARVSHGQDRPSACIITLLMQMHPSLC